MPKLTPANRLYFYQLLSEELGRGVQVTLARAEEVLDADGMAPRDVECETWRELFDALDECVRVTVFKRGRTYVAVVANETYDELLERAARGTAKGAEKGKSFKRKRGGKDIKPEKPRSVPEPVVVVEPELESEPEPEHGSVLEVEVESVVEAEPEPELEAEAELEVEPEAEIEPESEPEPEAEPEPESEPEPEPEPEPVPAPEPTITLNITYDPRPEYERNPAPILDPDPAPPLSLADVPETVSRDVIVNDAALVALSGVYPLGADVIAMLDEDLAQARSAHALSGTRALIELPLRLELPSGERLVVRLKRKAPNRAGKRWSMQVPEDLPEAGVDGLPDAGNWPWAKLPSARLGFRPAAELSRAVETGSWDELVAQLDEFVPDETWNAKQLAAVVAQSFSDDALVKSADGQYAAFALPIVTAEGSPVVAFLEAREGATPWRMQGLEAAKTLEPPLDAARPVSHVSKLSEAMVVPGSTLDNRLNADAEAAFARAQLYPRLAVSAFDPLSKTPLLLLPLGEDVLAITPTGDESYRTVALLSRDEAWAMARSTGGEVPAWLEG